jgi:epoxyqueuosine reductase
MKNSLNKNPVWLTAWMKNQKVDLWGVADLREFDTPKNEHGQCFPLALSWVIPMDPQTMASIQSGPNQVYADEYSRVNSRINELSDTLTAEIKGRGFQSFPLKASERTDEVHIKGDFPHKTAATKAGIGWIGRHCQLITRSFGPWVRLGTVFTDMPLLPGTPIDQSYCGSCLLCVEACPANALKGNAWYPGILREDILDVQTCDLWKKKNYYQYHKGHNCGICAAVCPFELKILKRKAKNI